MDNIYGCRQLLIAGIILLQTTTCFCGDIIYQYDLCDRIKSATYTVSNSIVTLSHDAAHNVTESKAIKDVDGDGIPDYWEILNFSNLTSCTGTSDWNNNGLSDFEEYLLGANPTQAGSSFVCNLGGTPPVNPGYFIVRWSGATNRTYAIQLSTNLPAGFSSLATNIPGTPPVSEYRHDTLAPSGFYRIRMEGGAE